MGYKQKLFLAAQVFWALSFFCFAPFGAATAEAAGTQILKAERIEQGALDFLKARFSLEENSAELEIYYSGRDIVLPRGKLHLDYRSKGKASASGKIPVFVQVKVNGVLKRKLRLNVQVLVSYRVVKTRRPIQRGMILSEDDVLIEIIKSARMPKRVATRLEEVVGYEALRNLGMDQLFPLNSLRRPYLVQRGDRIVLVAERGSMKITAPGIVRKRGYKNEMVEVLNTQTRKTVYGRLVDANTVKVNY